MNLVEECVADITKYFQLTSSQEQYTEFHVHVVNSTFETRLEDACRNCNFEKPSTEQIPCQLGRCFSTGQVLALHIQMNDKTQIFNRGIVDIPGCWVDTLKSLPNPLAVSYRHLM